MREVELLAPAKSLEVGLAAIRNGADAVYIGAPQFGARRAASNSLEDIQSLVNEAHKFYCRVFVTMNTLLYDNELSEAEALIWKLYEIGVDALIVQDLGILKMKLPPIALHASTQTHNYDIERIKFLDRVGFSRIVLARELGIEEIRRIRKEIKAEIEVFVHGALCVSFSGQCYMSEHIFGRSANRGECAQLCRQRWSLIDANSKTLIKEKHLLSLRDMKRVEYLRELADAGVTSFKIEGRLKDIDYVSNVTAYYSDELNRCLGTEYRRSGSGVVKRGFEPDLDKTFNRGYTNYFANGRGQEMTNIDTPKSMGKFIGTVERCKRNEVFIKGVESVNNGDGLCYIEHGELVGVRVNRAEGNHLFIAVQGGSGGGSGVASLNIKPGTKLFRNYDHNFSTLLEKSSSVRKIGARMLVSEVDGRLKIGAVDESCVSVEYISEKVFDVAQNPSQRDRLVQQLSKFGDTDFWCMGVEYLGDRVLFVPSADANLCRREALELLMARRLELRPIMEQGALNLTPGYIAERADWQWNVVNELSREFYSGNGCSEIEPGFEVSKQRKGKAVMTTKFCLLYENGRCLKGKGSGKRAGRVDGSGGLVNSEEWKLPLRLDSGKEQFLLRFDCKKCQMIIESE